MHWAPLAWRARANNLPGDSAVAHLGEVPNSNSPAAVSECLGRWHRPRPRAKGPSVSVPGTSRCGTLETPSPERGCWLHNTSDGDLLRMLGGRLCAELACAVHAHVGHMTNAHHGGWSFVQRRAGRAVECDANDSRLVSAIHGSRDLGRSLTCVTGASRQEKDLGCAKARTYSTDGRRPRNQPCRPRDGSGQTLPPHGTGPLAAAFGEAASGSHD